MKPHLHVPGLTCGRPGASWAFLSCPPEDECSNGHHDCNETQDCRDRPRGYECSCKAGYTMDKWAAGQAGGRAQGGAQADWAHGQQYRVRHVPEQDGL